MPKTSEGVGGTAVRMCWIGETQTDEKETANFPIALLAEKKHKHESQHLKLKKTLIGMTNG